MTPTAEILRSIPPVGQILQEPPFQLLQERFPRRRVVEAVQSQLESLRKRIRAEEIEQQAASDWLGRLPEIVEAALQQRFAQSLREVINATGVLIHTNAGRAPLSPVTAESLARLATGYSNLEYDLEEGRRGHRDRHFEEYLRRLLPCQAATVCNNNAAAVFLILHALAAGKKVLVSRGELVEIGGSFRIPSIMEASGARLCEVGTTNKTHIADYENAIDEETALILRVHPSNYRIVGFTRRPSIEQLVELSRKTSVPLVKDAGSGLLFDSDLPFLEREPSIHSVLEAGVDLVCFSGDKLLGGPQAGLIAGRRDLVERLRKNPLMRVLRVDKLTYKALQQTLLCYDREDFESRLPIHRMLRIPASELKVRCRKLAEQIPSNSLKVELAEGFSLIGGGSAPGERIPTWLLSVSSSRNSARRLEEQLRKYQPPILARIENDRLLIDLRTVEENEEVHIINSLNSIT